MPTRIPNIQCCFRDFAYDAENYMIHFYRQKTRSVSLVSIDFVGVATPDPMKCLKARTWTVQASSANMTTYYGLIRFQDS